MNASTRGWLHRDGAWLSTDAIPLTDRAMRYGMSVFETIGVRDGQPLFFEQHARLLASSVKELLGVEIAPEHPPLETSDRGMLRVYVTAGDGGPADAVDKPRVLAIFESLSGALPDFQTARIHPATVALFAHGAKTGNYWAQCAAQTAARAGGFDHALLADGERRLLSAAMGNIFFVEAGSICTPSLKLAVRPGVMRSWVMEQEPVREVEVPVESLNNADEIFLTNSRLGVVPLRLGNLQPGPVGCALRDRCRREKLVP